MEKSMKKIAAVLVAVCLCMLSVVSVFAQQDGPDVKAEAYCVVNRKDGSIVYSKNMDDRYYPASITKIMTALVTLEHCTNLDDTVVFNSEVMDSISSNSSTLNPVAILDEEMTVRDALFGLMLNSANECASALAVYTAGSIDAFVEMMNEKAQELGAVNTHYMNAHGLDDDDHYTTAHDMAIIFDAALKNDTFRYIDSSATYTIPATNKYGERTCTSTNQLINGALPYEGVYDGKTGHTAKAGRTLVTAAYRDGMDLICVIMKSDNDNFYSDTETLLDHAFLKVQGNEQENYAAADDYVMAQNELASGLNVRQYPSTYAPRIGSLMPGDAVHRIGTFGNWSQIETINGVGYVSSQYLIFQDGSPVGTYEVVNTLTADQTVPEPELSSVESDEPEAASSEEASKQEEPESQASAENESVAANSAAASQSASTAAAGPTIPEQTYRYQLTVNNLTMIVIGVIFAIALVVAILTVTLIRRRDKGDDESENENESEESSEEVVPMPISAQEKVQKAQKAAKAHVKESARAQAERTGKASKKKRASKKDESTEKFVEPVADEKENEHAKTVQSLKAAKQDENVWKPQEIEEADWDDESGAYEEYKEYEDDGAYDEYEDSEYEESEEGAPEDDAYDEDSPESNSDFAQEEYSEDDDDDWGDEILEDDWDEDAPDEEDWKK